MGRGEGRALRIQEEESQFQHNARVVKHKLEHPELYKTREISPNHPHYKKHMFYIEHREEIVAYLLKHGRTATRKKFSISTSSTLFSLEKHWLTLEQRAAVPQGRPGPGKKPREITSSTDGHFPEFPHFSDSWDPGVQVKWLEVYPELVKNPSWTRAGKPSKTPPKRRCGK